MSGLFQNWRRAARFGLTVGLLQVLVNQGDRWLTADLDASTVLKSLFSPLLTFSVALLSSRPPHPPSAHPPINPPPS